MAFPEAYMPAGWIHPGLLVLVMLLGSAAYTAPVHLEQDRARLNAWLIACVILLMLWRFKAGMAGGLSIHFLGLTALTLMFGWQLALTGAALITAALTLAGLSGWQAYGLNVLIDGAVPVLFSYAFFRLVDRFLINHFFIYIFVSAFLGGALAMAMRNLALGAAALLSGAWGMDQIHSNLLPVSLLLLFPEAMLNGMAMTIFVVYRPQWVRTFDDRRYIENR